MTARHLNSVVVGVDIGQRRDPTAVAVVEVQQRENIKGARQARREKHYLVRHLERLPLGTAYTEVAARVSEICRQVRERSHQAPALLVDATGVGAPVVDLLRADASLRASVWAVLLTHGDRLTVDPQERRICLGKRKLSRNLAACLGTGRLHLPPGPESRALASELRAFELRVDENGTDRWGAFQNGTHDDLVVAVGLAVQDIPAAMPARPVAPSPTRLR